MLIQAIRRQLARTPLVQLLLPPRLTIAAPVGSIVALSV
jgi:hypothetical protein